MATQTGPIPGLDTVVLSLIQARAGAAEIFSLVALAIGIWKAVKGESVSLDVYANLIESQVAENDAEGKANADHFRQLIAERGQ